MTSLLKPNVAQLKFIYSEKATNFCEISTIDLSYVVTVKSTVEISQNLVVFSEYMNFKNKFLERISSHYVITIQMLGHVPCTPRVVCTLSSNCYTMRWSIISLQEAQKFHPQFIGIYGHTHIFYPMSFFSLKRSTSFQGTFFIMSQFDFWQMKANVSQEILNWHSHSADISIHFYCQS